jgi:alpha-glucuronidase
MFMKRLFKLTISVFLLFCVTFNDAFGADGYDLWLGYNRIESSVLPAGYSSIAAGILAPGSDPSIMIARDELRRGLEKMLGRPVPVVAEINKPGIIVIGTPTTVPALRQEQIVSDLKTVGQDGFVISTAPYQNIRITYIAANTPVGALYGAYHYLRLVGTLQPVDNLAVVSIPKIQRRMLNHWDNLNGSIERGYAGTSLWRWSALPDTIDQRYRDYARAMASIGLNGTVLNNVNASPLILGSDYLPKIAALATVFRPYGVKVYLSINFGSPLKPAAQGSRQPGGVGTLDTADPLDPAVQAWWKAKADEIYTLIPDFGGFLVKANSEGMPGPNDYKRTHADGANMLAKALAPHGGIVMWRAFVYDESVDTDRTKRAFMEFKPLDGKFDDNVIVQVKNGALDFQAREPINPIFGAMPKTQLMPELQVTKEYLGHEIHLVYLAPMWKEFFDFDTYAHGKGTTAGKIADGSAQGYKLTAIAGVANTGSDRNWCGHDLLQANWYAFGRLAWDYTLTSEQIAGEWTRQTLTRDPKAIAAVNGMLMGSREACVNYMVPLGLHFLKEQNIHYGPDPAYSRGRADYTATYYHKADSLGIGFDRSSTGSNLAAQYFPPVRDMYDNLKTCPDNLLLWFHHVPWDYKLSNGRILWDELCYRYYSGVAFVSDARKTWTSLANVIDPGIHTAVAARLEQHERDAGIWRDTCVQYFQTYSKRPIPPDVEKR